MLNTYFSHRQILNNYIQYIKQCMIFSNIFYTYFSGCVTKHHNKNKENIHDTQQCKQENIKILWLYNKF